MDWQQILSVGLTVSTIGTLTGLGLLRGIVTNLREQLRDERDQSVSLRAQRLEDHRRIEGLTTDLNALGRVVTGEAHWTAIGAKLDQHHDHARMHWTAELAMLEAVRDLLREARR